jgi:ubiquitin thioesterase OTU1
MSLSPLPVSPPSFHTTVFPVSDAAVFSAGEKLVAALKKKKYFTDTANFDLRCGICGIGLKGEKGAREHAMATGREYERCPVSR